MPRTRHGVTATRSVPAPAEAIDNVFGALADPTRRALIVTLLREGPSTATNLADGGDLTRQAIVKHLKVLAAAGLVTSKRAGREVNYRAMPEQMAAAIGWMLDAGAAWDRRIDRLRKAVD